MNTLAKFSRRYLAHIISISLILVAYAFASLPTLSKAERSRMAKDFKFKRLPLPELPGRASKSVREVHPSLQHIAGWISSVGAAVALNDLDRDGLSNDVCYVNTRTNQVIVTPAPGSPQRYKPFELIPTALYYDPDTMAPMGSLPGDFNEDGLMDILVYYWGRTPVIFLRKEEAAANVKNPTPSSYVEIELVPEGGRWFTNAATQADLDGDGHVDLIIGNYFPDDAQILDAKAGGKESMQDSMSRAYNGGRNRLMLWTMSTVGPHPTVRFMDIAGVLSDEVAGGWTLAVGAADLDGDLRPEIYFANDFGPDRLLHNESKPGLLKFSLLEGKRTLATPRSKTLGRDSFKGMGVEFGDLNGDGILDIYVSNIASEFALEESHFVWISTGETDLMKKGIAPYTDKSEPLGLSRSGWGWDARLADFNNDGVLEALQAVGFMKGTVNRWPELHEVAMGNDQLLKSARSWHHFQPGDDLGGQKHNPFFVRSSDGRYYDLASEIGIDAPQLTRGIAVGDINGDGRLDFITANQWEPSYAYINESPDVKPFLALHLLTPVNPTNGLTVSPGHPAQNLVAHPAIGAQAIVRLPNGKTLVAQVDGGTGHSGKRSPDLHFGLGDIPPGAKVSVEIHYKDSSTFARTETLQLSPGWHTVVLGW
jgi:enediyne biosynthesis protein E4